MHSTITSTVGGVMTDEVGATTGELEVCTLLEDGLLNVYARYAGAEEWYTVTGCPVPLPAERTALEDDLHRRVVQRLTSPGPAVDGNEEAVSLRGFSAA